MRFFPFLYQIAWFFVLLSFFSCNNNDTRRTEYLQQVKAQMCQESYELVMLASPIPSFVIELFDNDRTKEVICTCLMPVADEELKQYTDEELFDMTIHKNQLDKALRQLIMNRRGEFYPCIKEKSSNFYDKVIAPFTEWLDENKDKAESLMDWLREQKDNVRKYQEQSNE